MFWITSNIFFSGGGSSAAYRNSFVIKTTTLWFLFWAELFFAGRVEVQYQDQSRSWLRNELLSL